MGGLFTTDEEDALRAYCGDDFHAINAHLRGEEEGSPRIADLIRAIDSAFFKAEPVDVRHLYRGLNGDVVSYLRRRGLGVGSILSEQAYMSTSDRLLGARTFAAWPPGGLIIELKVPGGLRAIDLDPYSQFPEEAEYLLPRGSRLLVTALDYDMQWMEAEVL